MNGGAGVRNYGVQKAFYEEKFAYSILGLGFRGSSFILPFQGAPRAQVLVGR